MLVPDDKPTRAHGRGDARPARPAEPSKVHIPGLLDGLSVINSLVDQYLGHPPARLQESRLSVVRVNY